LSRAMASRVCAAPSNCWVRTALFNSAWSMASRWRTAVHFAQEWSEQARKGGVAGRAAKAPLPFKIALAAIAHRAAQGTFPAARARRFRRFQQCIALRIHYPRRGRVLFAPGHGRDLAAMDTADKDYGRRATKRADFRGRLSHGPSIAELTPSGN
jgi:hypothetical protein